jgi:hypothetical protein
MGDFVSLATASGHQLDLTESHYIPVRVEAANTGFGEGGGAGDGVDNGGGGLKRVLAAKDVTVGMRVQVQASAVLDAGRSSSALGNTQYSRSTLVWSEVTGVSRRTSPGLYNPFTMSHSLVVNNVRWVCRLLLLFAARLLEYEELGVNCSCGFAVYARFFSSVWVMV